MSRPNEKKSANTSSFHLLSFWCALIVTVALCNLWVGFHPLPTPESQFETLCRYQKEKFTQTPPGAIVLLGDSSLGNGVSADVLSQDLGKPVKSFALTGIESFRGDYVVLRELLARGLKPSLVVAVHSLPSYTNKISERVETSFQDSEVEEKKGYAWYAARPFRLLALVRESEGYRRELFAMGKGLRLFNYDNSAQETAERWAGLQERDYLPQSSVPWSDKGFRSIQEFRPGQDHLDWLQKLYRLAQEHEVPILLATGPCYEEFFTSSFQEDYQRFLKQQPLEPLYNEIPGFPLDKLGDTEDHLTAQGKREFTTFLGRHLARWLGQN